MKKVKNVLHRKSRKWVRDSLVLFGTKVEEVHTSDFCCLRQSRESFIKVLFYFFNLFLEVFKDTSPLISFQHTRLSTSATLSSVTGHFLGVYELGQGQRTVHPRLGSLRPSPLPDPISWFPLVGTPVRL